MEEPIAPQGESVLEGITSRMSQNYSDMVIGEGMLGEAVATPEMNIPGFKQTTNFRPKYASDGEKGKSKKTIAKIFSSLSRWGMDYSGDIIDNMRAIPADKNLLAKPFQLQNQDLFSQQSSQWKVKSNQDKNFFEKDFPQKRTALRNLAVQDVLEDILDTMSNECIVYDSNYVYFAEPYIDPNDLKDFASDVQEKITNTVANTYRKLYKMLSWRTKAWDDFKRFLVEGDLAWEIVYDSMEKPTQIIGIVPIDAATLTKKYENGKWYWVQYKGVLGRERKLLDAQIIYLSYQETNVINRISYLERLIRPFNIYRIIEQAQIVWTVTNAQFKMMFSIPTKGMNKVLAKQTLATAMNAYKEDIKFIGDTGELKINGQVNMPFNKEYWLSENDNGKPEIEPIGGEGPELNDSDQLKYFKNQLYKMSKIPLNRFDQESGESWFGTDATSVARTEIDFGRFVTRLRNQFAQVILKPLQIQLALTIPELADMKEFLDSIQLHFKSYNLFEEMMEMELMQKRVDFIKDMKDGLVDMDKEGNEIKFWSSKFLVLKYLHLSDDDTSLNEKLKQQEIEELNLAGGEDGGGEESWESLKDEDKDMLFEVYKEMKKRKKAKTKKKDDEEE